MKEFITANWGWATYIIMAALPFLVGLLTKATWHPLVKFVCIVAAAVVLAVAGMQVTETPWGGAETGVFIASLVGAAEAAYLVLIKSFPAVQQYLDAHVNK